MRRKDEFSFRVSEKLTFIDAIVKVSLEEEILAGYKSTVSDIIRDVIIFTKTADIYDYSRLDNIYVNDSSCRVLLQNQF